MNFVERRDIFIAYHGTYDDYGSLNKEKQLFYFLESRGVKCYFFPTEKSAYFAETPVAVKNADKFLLICNRNIKTDADGTVVNNGIKQELQTFWNCIYEGKRQRGDARVYAYDGFTAVKANDLHIAFQGVAHFDESNASMDDCFEMIYDWIINGSDQKSFDRSLQSPSHTFVEPFLPGTTLEVERVFLRRSHMNKVWDISKMIYVARKIECLGISNNEMTLNMDEDTMKNALCQGMNLEILFLAPYGRHTRAREKEEGQARNTIRNNTNATLSFVSRLKKKLPDPIKNNLKIYIYDLVPRLNMIFIDGEHLLLQYYANAVPGASNPCFYIKKKEDGQLYDFFYEQYQYIRERGTEK